MTDLTEIREALAKATPIADARLIANAPAWLETLCDEVERLMGEVTREQMERSDAVIRAEKAEAEVERVRALADDWAAATCVREALAGE